jgi:hypothetical protein
MSLTLTAKVSVSRGAVVRVCEHLGIPGPEPVRHPEYGVTTYELRGKQVKAICDAADRLRGEFADHGFCLISATDLIVVQVAQVLEAHAVHYLYDHSYSPECPERGRWRQRKDYLRKITPRSTTPSRSGSTPWPGSATDGRE